MKMLRRFPWIGGRRSSWARNGLQVPERLRRLDRLNLSGLSERLHLSGLSDRLHLPDLSNRLHLSDLSDRLSLADKLSLPDVSRLRRIGRPERQVNVKTLVLAGLAGAVLAYLLDPEAGKRRRKVGRDRLLGAIRSGGRRVGRLGRHVASDTHGLGQKMLHPRAAQNPDLDDTTLARKVETELFRDPHVGKGNINVNVEHGVVILRGEVERPEQIAELTEGAQRIPGVRGVESLLHVAGGPYSG